MSEVRAFIAIDLPRPVVSKLDFIQQRLSENLLEKSVRWVQPKNIHLTLRFLGNVEHGALDAIYLGLEEVVTGIKRFNLDIGPLGCFPNPRRPKVIWVGVGGAVEELLSMHEKLSEMLAPLGWPPETRRFHPHLTLGRSKDVNIVIQARLPWGEELAEGQFTAAALHLIKSDLLPTGAEYTVLHSAIFTD
ncbi:MAG: RNA 2',3'-cyclic phosphodiesterase [Candidatus Promineifilaceae bacterium]|jgi:2'-5' RNA ligase